MLHIAPDSLASIYYTLTWNSTHAHHMENFLAADMSFTRDILPLGVKNQLLGLGVGDAITLQMSSSEAPSFKPGKVLDMPAARFQPPTIHGRVPKLRVGRFYPKHFIESVPGTRPDSATPFRVVGLDRGGFKADMNHPMADREGVIRAEVMAIHEPEKEPGAMKRWSETMLKGPGMQARLPDTPTDFLGAEPFFRDDETDDAEFYARPHPPLLDRQAQENVKRLLGKHLRDGMELLDLMAGADSHLPNDLKPGSVTGLGLSGEKMEANTALTERLIYNLNENQILPFEDETFDAVICTESVEYLIHPFEVFEEAARVLKPGGVFLVSFSNRWFEEKVIRIWTELHEFERLGLISQYFIRTELFDDITTWSDRGWRRPDDRKNLFAGELPESDPIFAVWGRKK